MSIRKLYAKKEEKYKQIEPVNKEILKIDKRILSSFEKPLRDHYTVANTFLDCSDRRSEARLFVQLYDLKEPIIFSVHNGSIEMRDYNCLRSENSKTALCYYYYLQSEGPHALLREFFEYLGKPGECG